MHFFHNKKVFFITILISYLDVFKSLFLHTLKLLGFEETWCSWIKECVSTASASVLVNGSPSGEFMLQKGLRQGDPLSPFLFLIAAEGFCLLVDKARENGTFSGVTVGNDQVEISHLQFADDTLMFGKASKSNIQSLKGIIRSFELISGLEVNFRKSTLVGIHISEAEVEDFALEPKCKVGTLASQLVQIQGK